MMGMFMQYNEIVIIKLLDISGDRSNSWGRYGPEESAF